MATTKTYAPKSHIILDLEALSLDRHAAILEIAAVAQHGTHGHIHSTFEVKIKPSSYLDLPQFDRNAATEQFHMEHNPEILEDCEANGVSLQEAMERLHVWASSYGKPYDLHVWSQGKDYDFPILEYAFEQVGMKSPWSYRNVHCLRDLVFLNPRSRIGGGSKDAKHRALDDAIWAQKQFMQVIADSNWYQRLLA